MLKRKGDDGKEQPSLYRLVLDKPKATKEGEAMAFRVVKEAQRSSRFRNARFQSGKIWLDGTAYDPEEMDLLPTELTPAYISSPRSISAIVFFSRHSYLSNHYLANFTLEEITYS